jgi:titin
VNKIPIYLLFSISILLILPISLVYGATVPDKPTNLVADDVSPTSITLTWTKPQNDGGSAITGYKIEYKKVPNQYDVLVANTQSTATTYSHTGLQTGATYIYRVYAINAIGSSASSTEASAKPTTSSAPAQNIVPNPPTQLQAKDVSPTQVDLTWIAPTTNNGPPVTGYKLEFKSGSAAFATLANITSTSYSHKNATTGTAYSYRVFAINSVGLSNSSNTATATPTTSSAPAQQSIPPNSPSNLQVLVYSPTELSLSWKAPAPNTGPPITGYKIEYKKGSENYQVLVENNGLATTYQHKNLNSNTLYTYRVYAINSAGTSSPSNAESAKPQHTQIPQLTAKDVSPTQIELTWIPPSQTFGMSIGGYVIQEKISENYYETIGETGGSTTKFLVTGLQTDETYTYVVYATYSLGSSAPSNEASATPNKDSKAASTTPTITVPTPPTQLNATSSSNQIKLSWKAPTSDGNSPIKGYKIESRTNSTFTVLVADTKSTSTSYAHSQVISDTTYTYRVYAINSAGTSSPSNEASATAKIVFEIKPLGKFTINEEQTLQFTVSVTDSSSETEFSLDKSPPAGANIDSKTGKFTWTPTKSQGAKSYEFDIVAKKENLVAREGVTVTVNDVPESTPTPQPTPEPEPEPKESTIAPFVDPKKDPQYYIDRYNTEENYKDWFDKNYPDLTIYEAVGLPNPVEKTLAPFVDPNEDPQYYIDRYNNEPNYKAWFDKNFPDMTIYEAVGLPEPDVGICGPGTKFVNGVCKVDKTTSQKEGGGCLIATAAYGSEISPQVQLLREIRDNKVLTTESGSSFMAGFNSFYYSFSPTIADWERQNPVFKEAVKLGITPLLASLSILNHVDIDSEYEMLGYGIGIIVMNVGMYFVAPAMILYRLRK